MNTASLMMNAQEEIDPQHFIRQLGKEPILGLPRCSWAYDPELFAGTFGPPEINNQKRSSILFWNFVDRDGKPAFSLSVKSPAGRKVYLVSRLQTDTAYFWTGGRLSEADGEPLFLGAGQFVISRVC